MRISNRRYCNDPCNKSRTHYRTYGYYTLVCPSYCIWNGKSHSNRVSIPLPTGLSTLGVHYQLRLCNYRDEQRYRLLLNIFYTTFIHIRYPIYSGLTIYTLCLLHGHVYNWLVHASVKLNYYFFNSLLVLPPCAINSFLVRV